MEFLKQSFIFEEEINGEELLKKIEKYGRTCYQSEEKITENSYLKFVAMILRRGHESVIEHEKITIRFICNRGVSHEIVRHRIASYSQESTRYCNYKSNGIKYIKPFFYLEGSQEYKIWFDTMEYIEKQYNRLIELGKKPEEARGILPNDLKTEIVVTYNLREWRYFFKMRCTPAAHPQMREITIPLLKEFKKKIPIIFDDIVPYEG